MAINRVFEKQSADSEPYKLEDKPIIPVQKLAKKGTSCIKSRKSLGMIQIAGEQKEERRSENGIKFRKIKLLNGIEGTLVIKVPELKRVPDTFYETDKNYCNTIQTLSIKSTKSLTQYNTNKGE